LFLKYLPSPNCPFNSSPFQQVQYKNDTSQNPTTTKLNSASQEYIDGCTAVLQAKDNIYDSQDAWKTTFSTWENQGPYGSVNHFFF